MHKTIQEKLEGVIQAGLYVTAVQPIVLSAQEMLKDY